MSVAYGTIIRHEGKIEISNENGDKTEFIISIPIAEVKAAIKESVTISDEGQKSKILVIDDEEMIRNLLGDILNRLGHEATTASNGQEGVELFKSMKHDLVFTDLGMPGLSGWEVAHQIKSYDQNSVIIMITGWGVELSDRELSEKQVDFVISKPFRLHQIREVIPKALNLRK